MIHGKAPFSKDRLRASLTLLFSAQSNLHFRLAKPMFLLMSGCNASIRGYDARQRFYLETCLQEKSMSFILRAASTYILTWGLFWFLSNIKGRCSIYAHSWLIHGYSRKESFFCQIIWKSRGNIVSLQTDI